MILSQWTASLFTPPLSFVFYHPVLDSSDGRLDGEMLDEITNMWTIKLKWNEKIGFYSRTQNPIGEALEIPRAPDSERGASNSGAKDNVIKEELSNWSMSLMGVITELKVTILQKHLVDISKMENKLLEVPNLIGIVRNIKYVNNRFHIEMEGNISLSELKSILVEPGPKIWSTTDIYFLFLHCQKMSRSYNVTKLRSKILYKV